MIFIWTCNEYLLHFGYVLVGYLHAGVTGQILDRFLNKRQKYSKSNAAMCGLDLGLQKNLLCARLK